MENCPHTLRRDVSKLACRAVALAQRAKVGGAERDRTAGLLVANEALSQLSYSPTT
jgi:hypothetical protein